LPYSELQIPGDAIAATKTLDDDKLAECMHSHPLHTIEGDIAVGPDGEWTKAQPIWVQYHGIRARCRAIPGTEDRHDPGASALHDRRHNVPYVEARK